MHIASKLTTFATAIALALALPLHGQHDDHAGHEHESEGEHQSEKAMKPLPAPQMGYLKAHKDLENPPQLLGGPIIVTVKQESGGVHVALPAHRDIDPQIFGTPDSPLLMGGKPLINGLPEKLRGVENGKYTQVKKKSPFGNKSIVLPGGTLGLRTHDRQATDGATTTDKVEFRASWEDKEGNTYVVTCFNAAPHGVEYPSFGGVVTNHLMHGFTRIGTPLMPTEFAFVAFWGIGEVKKNGEVVGTNRIVHGMLTEYVRGEDYKLVFDEDVTPTRKHFHLMVPPMVVENGKFVHKALKTGFMLPNDMELPFWHVMFQNLEIDVSHE